MSWLSIAIFGSLPFIFSTIELSITDAFFESMSGITTTGSTIISNLENTPKGILLWRAILQWLGGIGIIVMAITPVSYTHLRAHETPEHLVCRLLLEKKKM